MANNPKNPAPNSSLKNSKEQTQKIAILFTDMKGSTTFYKKHGNLAGRIMVQKLNDMLFPIIRKNKGVIVKTIGDSIMAYFMSPDEALWATIKIQKKLKTYNSENTAEEHLLIRTVLNYGHGIIEENDVFGDVVNIAGKLISSCEAQQIIISESLYEKTKNSENITFSPYRIKDAKKELLGLKTFQVDWENAEEPESTGKLYLLSLMIEETSKGENYSGNIEKILNIIKHDSSRHINIEENEANVIFTSWKTCLEAAKLSLQKYLEHAPVSGDLPHILRFGLHSMDEENLDSISPAQSFTEPIKARKKADPYGIAITSKFYNEMSTEFKNACTVQQENPCKLYTFHCDGIKKRSYEIAPLVPKETYSSGRAPCFYCNSTKHLTNLCPSKFIRKKTGFLEKLGYVPNSRLQDLFKKSFISIVQPLESGKDEARFEMLFKENSKDIYTTAFFSFYEISEIFQIRSIRQTYMGLNPNIKKQQSPRKLLLGEDCLRVSKLEEAANYFKQAAEEQPDDYRPYIARGILYMEISKPNDAILSLSKALSYCADENLKNYIHLLIARIHEISGDLSQALKQVNKIGRPFSEQHDITYYYAVLLAKIGETKSSICMFKSLIRSSPRYYLMVSLNPELSIIHEEITELLTGEFTAIRNKSSESIELTKNILENYGRLLDDDNEDYKKAEDLFQKALTLHREESISGLIDIIGYELNITTLVTGAIDRAFKSFKKKILKFENVLNKNYQFLSNFPYKRALSKKDFKLRDDFKAIIDEANQTANTQSSREMDKLSELLSRFTKASSKIALNQKRLEIVSNTIFAVEFSLKSIFVFIFSGALTTFVFTSILVIYKMYENSTSSLSEDEFSNVLRFGICAGVIFATFITGFWINKKYV
jgi:class 3 adenylate cyclase/tetratricopeptide (TPR) repeat protein